MSQIEEHKILSLAWYAFRVKTGKERAISRLLVNKGYDAPLPEVSYPVRASRKSKRRAGERRFPALRSYMIVGFADRNYDNLLNVRDTLWVRAIVCSPEGKPLRIPGKEVHSFLMSEKLTFRELMRRAKPDFEEDDTVMFTEGAFTSRRGKVVGMCAETRRALVEVPMLGSVREIDVDFSELKKVDAEAA